MPDSSSRDCVHINATALAAPMFREQNREQPGGKAEQRLCPSGLSSDL